MVNRRHQLNFPDGQDNFPPLAIIDLEQDIVLGKKINHSSLGGWVFSKVHPPRQ